MSSRIARPFEGLAPAAAALALALAIAVAHAGPADQERAFEARVATVEALLAASRRITSTDTARRLEQTLATMVQRARDEQAAGRHEQAAARLDDAYRLVRASIQANARGDAAATARSPDPVGRARALDARRDSLRALGEAYQRLRAESGESGADAVAERVAALEEQADAHRRAGEIGRAGERLDEALAALQTAIARHRHGRTLVRELSFESPVQEYEYELDRFETHRLLTDLVLRERGVDRVGDEGVSGALQEAQRLRGEAARQAGEGRHEQAIQTLESATSVLVKLLRASGLYIPG